MDVDLLRPGTVPISSDPETVLWFEFLLDQKLLKQHLRYPFPESTATDLIAEFLSVDTSTGIRNGRASERSVDRETPTPPDAHCTNVRKLTRKELALKILALKTASMLNWNLDTFESKLTPVIQQQLVQDLVYIATDGTFSVPPQEIPAKLFKKPQVRFALTLYHRWILRFPVKATLQAKSAKIPFLHPGIPLENGFPHKDFNFDKILRISINSRLQSIKYLEDVIAYFDSPGTNNKEPKLIKVPVMDTFVHPTEDTDVMAHDWDAGDAYICHHELLMQIHFDLCYNYFFYGQHEEAKKHIVGCRKHQTLLEHDVYNAGYGPYDKVPWGRFNYASVSEDDILGYIRALNLGDELLDEERSLLQRLQECVANGYAGIISVLQADNLTREIPMIHRQVAELDIQVSATTGAITVPKDLVIRVSALNAVRYALEGGLPPTHPEFLNKFKTVGIFFFDVLFWALAPVLMSRLSEDNWNKLRMFFLHLATSSHCKLPIDRIDDYLKKHVGVYASEIRAKLISDEHLQAIVNDLVNGDDENMRLPRELIPDDRDANFGYKAAPQLEMGRLKKRLIEASTADDVRTCLVELAAMSPSSPLSYWKPPGGLGTLMASLPRGFLQDFVVVAAGAARARREAGEVRAALSLLSAAESEVRSQLGSDPALLRLHRALCSEVLLLQVNLMLAEWPHHRLNLTLLGDRCKAALSSADSGDSMGSLPQVTLAAWVCLLNICEWEAGGARPAPGAASAVDVTAALCAACAELQRGKGARKFPRTLWDYVLLTFNNCSNGPLKRSHPNNRQVHHGHTNHANHRGQLEHRAAYHAVLHALREPLAISVMLSLLARIYNVLVDDSSLELVVEYTNLWPNNIYNGNNYNPKCILESLTELLERSLKFYPYNTSWLRLYGDVEMAGGRHGAALRRYLCALAVGSRHFAGVAGVGGVTGVASVAGVADVASVASVARRAARCCRALAATVQAAALCQLPDDPDYALAFKCLAEQRGDAADATDAYYGCLWDGTLLEAATALPLRRGASGAALLLRRGAGRRARAAAVAGALELNAHNHEDVRREAAAVRGARLLRALTAQYVV